MPLSNQHMNQVPTGTDTAADTADYVSAVAGDGIARVASVVTV